MAELVEGIASINGGGGGSWTGDPIRLPAGSGTTTATEDTSGSDGGDGSGGDAPSPCAGCEPSEAEPVEPTGAVDPGLVPEDGEAPSEDCSAEVAARQAADFVTTLGKRTPSCTLAWLMLAGGAMLVLNLGSN